MERRTARTVDSGHASFPFILLAVCLLASTSQHLMFVLLRTDHAGAMFSCPSSKEETDFYDLNSGPGVPSQWALALGSDAFLRLLTEVRKKVNKAERL